MRDDAMTPPIVCLPSDALVVLVGITGAGKTTFARRRFSSTQILSSDRFRAMLTDSENDMVSSREAFRLLHDVLNYRLLRRLLTLVDATNTLDFARKDLLAIAACHDVPAVAFVLDVPYSICVERTMRRADRPFGEEVVLQHYAEFQAAMKTIRQEGFQKVHILHGIDEIEQTEIQISPSQQGVVVPAEPDVCEGLFPLSFTAPAPPEALGAG